MQLLPRDASTALRRLTRGFPVVAVTGPRQSGKTTLVRASFPGKVYVSIEDPDERALAFEGPRAFLGRLARGGVMLQELPADQISAVATLMERYADHPMDLADASLICLAGAIGVTDIITVDPSGFDTCRTGVGKRFKNPFLS